MRYKTIIYMTIAVAAATSCIERHPDNFGDISSVYFNNRGAGNVLLDTTDVTFVYEPLDETRMEVPVTVQLLGRAVGYDRQVDITVSSDNASEGTDYILPENAILPAGEYSFDYTVTLLRTEALETAKKEGEAKGREAGLAEGERVISSEVIKGEQVSGSSRMRRPRI